MIREDPIRPAGHGTHPTSAARPSFAAHRSFAGRPAFARLAARLAGRWRDEEGAATAEYAVATMAAVGFAGLLVVILRGDEVRGILTDLIRRALTIAG